MNDSLERLIAALEQQTAAINKLAESNMALVSIVLNEGDGELVRDPDAPLGRYMDGQAIRAGD